MTDYTQAAAQKCADLANEVSTGYKGYSAHHFLDSSPHPDRAAFRREVEAKQAMIREVLALTDDVIGDTPRGRERLRQARDKLRENLLPDAKPTLLEEFMAEYPTFSRNMDFAEGARTFADWIAKRGVEVKTKGEN